MVVQCRSLKLYAAAHVLPQTCPGYPWVSVADVSRQKLERVVIMEPQSVMVHNGSSALTLDFQVLTTIDGIQNGIGVDVGVRLGVIVAR